jgi:hypothetical protein
VREPAPSIERIGSARRAWVSVRNTTAIFAPLWILSLFLGPTADNGDWADLTWVALGSIYYAVAIVLVLPVFAFTLGRWIDKRTWRSTRKAVLTFGYYGLAWGVVAVGLYGFGGNASGGLLLWLLIPGVAAAVARLLLDVRSVSWTIISWVVYVFAMLPVLYVLLIQLTGGFNIEV